MYTQNKVCLLLKVNAWNNGKSGAKLDLTSSTTPGLQIHTVDHTRTANPFDWLLCRRAKLLLVGCPNSLVCLHLPVVEGLIFCISATPHLGTSFPLFHELPRTAGSKKWHSINDGLRGVIRNCTKSDKSAPAQQSPAISSTISCEQEGKVLDHANIRESLFNQIFI